jgi:hypothetical protein
VRIAVRCGETYRSTFSVASCWPLTDRVRALNVSRRLTGRRDDPGIAQSSVVARCATLCQQWHYMRGRSSSRRSHEVLTCCYVKLPLTGSHAAVAGSGRVHICRGCTEVVWPHLALLGKANQRSYAPLGHRGNCRQHYRSTSSIKKCFLNTVLLRSYFAERRLRSLRDEASLVLVYILGKACEAPGP